MKSRAELERLIDRATLLHAGLAQRIDALGDGQRLVIDENEAVMIACLAQDLSAAVRACLPEERRGQCMCEGTYTGYRWNNKKQRWEGHGCRRRWPVCSYCQECGAELCADGIARRNADAGRVERVRQALEEWCVDGFVADAYIRAALDGPQGGADGG